MGELFYTGLLGADAVLVAILLLMVLLAVPIARVPGLFVVMGEALYYGRESTFFAYLSRYFSVSLFNTISHWQSALAITLCVYLISIHHVGVQANSWHDLLFPLILFVFLILFFFIRRLAYRLLAYLFVPQNESKEWVMRYALLEWLWGVSLLPALIIAAIPGALLIAIAVLVGLFLCWRIALFVKTIPALRAAQIGWLHLFVYLCAHEMLPFLYLAMGIWMAQSSKVAVLWQ